MSLEAIAALLGHRSLDMTLRYAKIASRTVADEYFAVSEKVEALYGQPAQLGPSKLEIIIPTKCAVGEDMSPRPSLIGRACSGCPSGARGTEGEMWPSPSTTVRAPTRAWY